MLKIEEVKEENGKIICKTNQGILREGLVVMLDQNYNGDLNSFFLNPDEKYKISEVLLDEVYGDVTLILVDHEEEPIYCDYLNLITPKSYYVFKWKGYYILAESVNQAQEIWNVSKLKGKNSDDLLFPKQITRLKAEAAFPSIVSDLDWEEVLFELK